MVLITIVTGAYKPTYNWGASHCSIETHGDDWINLPGHLHRWQSALWHWGGHEAVPIRRGDLGGDDLYRPATAMDGGMVKSQKTLMTWDGMMAQGF